MFVEGLIQFRGQILMPSDLFLVQSMLTQKNLSSHLFTIDSDANYSLRSKCILFWRKPNRAVVQSLRDCVAYPPFAVFIVVF